MLLVCVQKYLLKGLYSSSSEHIYSYSTPVEPHVCTEKYIKMLEEKFDCVVFRSANVSALKILGEEVAVALAVSELDNFTQAFFVEREVCSASQVHSDVSVQETVAMDGSYAPQRREVLDCEMDPTFATQLERETTATTENGSQSAVVDEDQLAVDSDMASQLRELAKSDLSDALRRVCDLKKIEYAEYAECCREVKQDMFDWFLNRSISVEQCARDIQRERLGQSEGSGAFSCEGEQYDDELLSDDDAETTAQIGKESQLLAEPFTMDTVCSSSKNSAASRAQFEAEADKEAKRRKKAQQKRERKMLRQQEQAQQAQAQKAQQFQQGQHTQHVKPVPDIDSVRQKSPVNQATNGHDSDYSPLRAVVIDGNNVAREHGRLKKVFSSRGIQIAVNYFKQRGHTEIVVYVPQWRPFGDRAVPPTEDGDLLIALHDEGLLEYTPSRKNPLTGRVEAAYDDWYIVNAAHLKDGVIISNDQFRDVILQHPEFAETVATKTVPFNFLGDTLILPPDPRGRFNPSLEAMLRKTNAPPVYYPSPFLPSVRSTPTFMTASGQYYVNGQSYAYPQAYASSFLPNGHQTPWGPHIQQYSSHVADVAQAVHSYPQTSAMDRSDPSMYSGAGVGISIGMPSNAASKSPKKQRPQIAESDKRSQPSAAAKPKSSATVAVGSLPKVAYSNDSEEEKRQTAEAIRRSKFNSASSTQTQATGFVVSNGNGSPTDDEYMDMAQCLTTNANRQGLNVLPR